MKVNTNDLWEMVGELEEEDIPHVLTGLFTFYEKRLEQDQEDQAAALFFQTLSQTLTQVNGCNLNRR